MFIHNRATEAQSQRCGMSLIEVVLAIAVAGFVLASAVSLMVSVSSIWSERSERYFFVDHVEGVTEFLNATLAIAGVEITGGANGGSQNNSPPNQGGGSPQGQPQSGSGNALGGSLISSTEEPIRWEQPPGFAKYEDPLLHFSIADAPPLLVDPEDAPALGIRGFLHFEEDEGLSLLWYSILQEEVEDINDLRRTLISPLVTAITYIYWDERFEQWEEEDRPLEDDETDEFMLPRFIKLTFEYEEVSAERMLTIPVPSRSALLF